MEWLRTLPAELAIIDELLDDERFMQPYIQKHPTKTNMGRSTALQRNRVRLQSCIDETESGFVTGYVVYEGNSSDDDLLVPAVEAHMKKFGQAPKAVATDCGFSSKKNEIAITEMGVGHSSLPRKGKKGQARTEHENQPWFKDLQRYRAAGEAKISLLKRKYGLSRSRYRGLVGSKSWVGLGILTHNLQRAARMLKEEAK